MLNFTKKIVDLVFTKKKTPTYRCSDRVVQEQVVSFSMSDSMLGNKDRCEDGNSCEGKNSCEDKNSCENKDSCEDKNYSDDSHRSTGYEHFVIFPPFFSTIIRKDYVVQKNRKGNLIRKMSKYALYGLKNSHILLLIMYKVLMAAHQRKAIEIEDSEPEAEPVNRIDNDRDYDYIDIVTDLEDHSEVTPKKQENQDEEFEVVESSQEVVQQQEDDQIDALIKKHSQRYPMEACVVENLRDSPHLVREFVNM